MKKIKYIAMALVSLALASCMGSGYAEPDLDSNNAPYGNNEIKETNVLTIADLIAKYKSVINNSSYTKVEDDIQIKGIVTGNDIGGNIYNEVALQDETGALLVCVNASGLYGYMPVGQEILINLKGLYIGGYGMQPEIGGVYTNTSKGTQSIGKADRYVWEQHYKLIGTADASKVTPIEFDMSQASNASYKTTNASKLMTIKGVKFAEAKSDGSTVYAPNDGSVTLLANCANRNLADANGKRISNVVVRTSTYAKFANASLPTETVDITGIFTRYTNGNTDTWQILLRTSDDVQPSK